MIHINLYVIYKKNANEGHSIPSNIQLNCCLKRLVLFNHLNESPWDSRKCWLVCFSLSIWILHVSRSCSKPTEVSSHGQCELLLVLVKVSGLFPALEEGDHWHQQDNKWKVTRCREIQSEKGRWVLTGKRENNRLEGSSWFISAALVCSPRPTFWNKRSKTVFHAFKQGEQTKARIKWSAKKAMTFQKIEFYKINLS